MSAPSLSWFDDSPRDLARWAIAGAVVVGIHAGAVAYLLATHQPDEIGGVSDVVTVELAPIDSTPDAIEQDVAPAPETMVESQPLPDLPQPKPEQEDMKVEQPPDETPTEVPTTRAEAAGEGRGYAAAGAAHGAAGQRRRAGGRSRHGRQAWCGNCSASSAIRPRRNRATSRAWCS